MAEHEKWHWQEPGTAWKGAGLYHITLTIPSREPLLGTLVIPEGKAELAKVEASPFGRTLTNMLWDLPHHQPDIQVLHYALMPDHLHMIWYVKRAIKTSIRSAVWGFWKGAQKLGRAYSYNAEVFKPTDSRHNYQESLLSELGETKYYQLEPIFTEQPFVRPLGQKRQLPTVLRYLDMNPQRLATKRLMPGYFRVQDGIEIAGRMYRGVGNVELLQAEKYETVHVRRTMVDEAMHGDDKRLRDYMNGCVMAARQGAVMVSPFISEKEKEVMVVLLAEEHPIIILADNGFRDYYKPSGGLFDSVAAGRVLILSPWEYDANKRHISRADCVALNGMAEEICRDLRFEISNI